MVAGDWFFSRKVLIQRYAQHFAQNHFKRGSKKWEFGRRGDTQSTNNIESDTMMFSLIARWGCDFCFATL